MVVIIKSFIFVGLVISAILGLAASYQLKEIQRYRGISSLKDDTFNNATILKRTGQLSLVLNSRFVRLLNVPDVMQATDYTCGPTSLLAVLTYYNLTDWRQSDLAKLAQTDPDFGTRPQDLLAAIKAIGLQAQMKQNLTIPDLENYIRANQPVIVEIQAWADPGTDYKNDWDDGHYVVVIGFDQDYLYFEDPWILGNIGYIKKTDFPDRWHDIVRGTRKVYNLGIIIHTKQVATPPIVELQ